MYIRETNTGRTQIWICKEENNYEHRFGKYEIHGLIKLIGITVLVLFSFILGAVIF